jgi:hypothetical protein
MSEKIGGAKGTELDDEFVEMERVGYNSYPHIVYFVYLCNHKRSLNICSFKALWVNKSYILWVNKSYILYLYIFGAYF